MANPAPLNAAIAAHRFGLGEASLAAVGSDAQGWLLSQIGPADVAQGANLLSTAQALDLVHAEQERRRLARNPAQGLTAEAVVGGHYREVIATDLRSRLVTAATTRRPFAERLQLFWANHFTVSLAKGSVRGLVGAFEREAIRPYIAGAFEDLLLAATTHPAMLRYLDNTQSAGPNSRAVAFAARRARRLQEDARLTGLNENLAREILELHTLGVDGGYSQPDVTAFAAVLTGWRVSAKDDGTRFDAAWHEPGPKTVLGKRYPEGAQALHEVLHDLALHPSTARFIATKLARHFVADDPSAELIDRLAARYRRSGGQLGEVYRELVQAPQAWQPAPAKLKTPEEFVVSAARVLGLGERWFERNDAGGIVVLGQRLHAAPSPAGWPDRSEDWLGPDAVWKRVEWSTRVGERLGRTVDARQVADVAFGPLLGEASQRQIERAADGPQALALLLMAPEFQRR
ncbi:DUF1800 domain-containing protein [Piscinibacter sp. XHJ-5]|uniref:DUF1800 domain-containing protein n=1 Tax=Piscinibacter sp. XHJ-5 TaxID=3037797 RepID=UPI002452F940|nr:DUF1800 domain-containing protein [Piscinibacter sp. XHJ-5]